MASVGAADESVLSSLFLLPLFASSFDFSFLSSDSGADGVAPSAFAFLLLPGTSTLSFDPSSAAGAPTPGGLASFGIIN